MLNVSEVIQTLDSGDFDDPMAEGSDDDLGMDVDYDSDNSEGIIQYFYNKKNTKAINST